MHEMSACLRAAHAHPYEWTLNGQNSARNLHRKPSGTRRCDGAGEVCVASIIISNIHLAALSAVNLISIARVHI